MGYKQRKNIEFVDGGIPYLLGQIAERDKELKDLQKEVASLAIESIEREKTLAKLEAEVMVWAKAEQEGRLVVLPCKVGQVVYGLYCDPDDENAIIGFEVAKIEMQSTSPTEYWAVGDDEGWAADEMTFTDEHIGKTVFLTREAAEAAMQEGGQDE